MTDEELIAYLRLQGLDKDITAADRIEALIVTAALVRGQREKLTVALAETEAKLAELVEAVRALRDAMRDNIIKNDEPHTVVLPDGSRHSGPVVDFLHALLGAQISALDAALARVKGEIK